MFRFCLSILVISLTVFVVIAADPKPELAKLSDRALIAEYGATLRAILDKGGDRDADFSFSRVSVRTEVLRRGRAVVPDLLILLRTEAPVERPTDSFFPFTSPVWDITEILALSGDPSAIPDLMNLLESDDKQVGIQNRRFALECIERLTFCSMRTIPHYYRVANLSIPLPEAIPGDTFGDLGKAAQLYRVWLAVEGKDPTQWLSLARKRAVARLGGDNPDAAYISAEFLFSHGGDRQQLVDALAKVTNEFKPGPKPGSWTYRNHTTDMPIGGWVRLLARLGPLARPHSALLIRIQKDQGDNAWGYYAWLREVSGDAIMDHLIEVLPRISVEVAALKADPKTPKGFANNDPRGWWYDSLREVQLAIDRWAGRQFPTDADRVTWWKANRGGSREQWLTKNLDVLVKQADANEHWAVWVAREVLPDAPHWIPDQATGTKTYTGWLAEHRSKLKYDPATEAFRLTPKAE